MNERSDRFLILITEEQSWRFIGVSDCPSRLGSYAPGSPLNTDAGMRAQPHFSKPLAHILPLPGVSESPVFLLTLN